METLKTKNISIRRIFLCRGAWLQFWASNILRLRWSIIWNAARLLLCRNGLGYHEYSCPKCNSKKRIPHTCKSRFCSSCGKAAADRWVETSLSQILDVEYKHLVFTLPAEFRDWFLRNRKVCLNAFFIVVKDTILDYARQKGFRPGLILVLHTFGSDLKWNPHIHVIITAGGLSLKNDQWLKCHYLPQKIIRPIYRYRFLQQFKKLFKQGLLKPPPVCRNVKSCETFNSLLTQFYNEAPRRKRRGILKTLQRPKGRGINPSFAIKSGTSTLEKLLENQVIPLDMSDVTANDPSWPNIE